MMKLALRKIKLTVSLLMFSAIILVSHASVVSFEKEGNTIAFKLDKGLMQVKICLDNMVGVKYTSLPIFLNKPSLVITNEWENQSVFTVEENADEIIIATAKLKVIVNKRTNSVKYTD